MQWQVEECITGLESLFGTRYKLTSENLSTWEISKDLAVTDGYMEPISFDLNLRFWISNTRVSIRGLRLALMSYHRPLLGLYIILIIQSLLLLLIKALLTPVITVE